VGGEGALGGGKRIQKFTPFRSKGKNPMLSAQFRQALEKPATGKKKVSGALKTAPQTKVRFVKLRWWKQKRQKGSKNQGFHLGGNEKKWCTWGGKVGATAWGQSKKSQGVVERVEPGGRWV